jgi:hypothetical protein
MKETFDLDQALEQIKRETPEVPTGFHDRWMEAVRKEAAGEKKEEKQSRQEPTGAGVEGIQQSREPARAQKAGMPQWQRMLSVAAVVLFLVGGTLLTRGKLNPVIRQKETEQIIAPEVSVTNVSMDAMNSAQAPAMGYRAETVDSEAAAGTLSGMETAEERAADRDTGSAAFYVRDESAEAEEEAPAMEADGSYDRAGSAQFYADCYEEAAGTMTSGMDRATVRKASGQHESLTGNSEGSADSIEAAETGGEDTKAEAEIAETKEQPETFLEQVGAFFADMGRFILYALPVILGAAALAVVVALMDRRRKNQRDKESSGGMGT